MCAEDAVVLAELVTGDLPAERALAAFMARRMPRVEIVVRNSMRLVRYEMGTEAHTDADVADAMSSTLGFLAASEAYPGGRSARQEWSDHGRGAGDSRGFTCAGASGGASRSRRGPARWRRARCSWFPGRPGRPPEPCWGRCAA